MHITLSGKGYKPLEYYNVDNENAIGDLQELKDKGILKRVLMMQIESTVDYFVENLEKGKE